MGPSLIKSTFYLFLCFCLLTACQPTAEDHQVLALKAAKAQDDQEMLAHFNHKRSNLEKNPVSSSNEFQALSMSLDASAEKEVKAILAQFNENSTNTNIKPDTDKPTKLDSTLQNSGQVIQNAAMLIGVRNYENTYAKIQELVQSYSATIDSEEERSTDFRMENTLVLKANPVKFQEMMQALRDLALVVREKRLWKQDLSAQFVDLKTRLENKYSAKTRLEQLLKKAKKSSEILPVQRELDLITEEIEALTKTARVLSSKAVSSTITITFYQEVVPMSPDAEMAFNDRVAKGAMLGWVGFKEFLVDASYNWPYVALGAVFFLTALIALRNSRRRARKFKLKAMQVQQQWIMQQQSNQNLNKSKVNN